MFIIVSTTILLHANKLSQHCKSLPVVLHPFWQLKDDLAIELSCVTYQGRFYIPSSMCKACLNLLHEGHPGIVKMKLRAQTSVYWIGLNKEIEEKLDPY